MTLRWQARGPHRIVHLIATADGVAALDEAGAIATFREGSAERAGELALPRPAARVARADGAWLAAFAAEPALVRVRGEDDHAEVARGRGAPAWFALHGRSLVVARGDAVEHWTDTGKLGWSADHPPCVKVATSGDVVAALSGEGVVAFFDAKSGREGGTLKLASTELAETWLLTGLEGGRFLLALGDRLVWVDGKAKKILKRVQARARIAAVASHGGIVVAGCHDGWLQAFDADGGEPRGAFEAHAGGIGDVALGAGAVFTTGRASHVLCAWERRALDKSAKGAAPISALAARADLAVIGESTGKARLVRGDAEIAATNVGGPVLAARVGPKDTLIAGSARVVVRLGPPYKMPRPIALRTVATALAMDDSYAFAGSATGEVDVHDLERSVHVTSYQLSEAGISAITRLPGALLVVGTGAIDGRLFVIDVAEAKVLHRLEAHDEAFGVTCLASDPRGRIVASGGDDAAVSLIDPQKGRVLLRIRVKETPIAIAFEPTGRRFACALADGTACRVSLGPKRAEVEDLGLRGVTAVAWAKELLVGYGDGRLERVAEALSPRADA